MNEFDPVADFPEFYDNIAIRALAGAQRWSISGQLGSPDDDGDDDQSGPRTRKAPIDARHLIDHHKVRGAWALDHQCLVTLDELTREVPNAANTAFYLRAAYDGLVVIDIEPGCPADVAANLLGLPGLIYTELSMSGAGCHLVTRLPTNLAEFPAAATKRVLRHENGWYEILLDHWITFTRRPLPPDFRPEPPTDGSGFSSVEELFAELARNQTATTGTASDVHTIDQPPEIEGAEQIIGRTLAGAQSRLKTPQDFGMDMSRYEFSVLGTLYHEMLRHLVGYLCLGVRFTPNEQAWLLYQAAAQVIPHRPKHNERRNNRPFLLDRAAGMVAQQITPDS